MAHKKEYFTTQELINLLGISKRSFYRRLNEVDSSIKDKEFMQKKEGKYTLYHKSFLEILDCQSAKKSGTHVSNNGTCVAHGTDDGTRKIEAENNKALKIKTLEVELYSLKEKLNERNLYINEIKETVEKQSENLSKKDDFIETLTNRHDTIILTMSKQLESLNQKMLLLEDKRKEEKEEQFIKNNSFNVYNAVIKASTIAILIIIYFKILYI